MARKGQKQKGQFDVKPGMVFTMPNMSDISRKYGVGANEHPWLVLKTYDDYVEVVMCSTLWSNKENKHRTSSLDHENTTDIVNPCPPMDRPQVRMSKVSLDTFTYIKKKDLFSNQLQIWNNNTPKRNFTTENTNALCLNQNELSNLRKEVLQYLLKHPEINYDPWKCEESENNLYNLKDGFPVPKNFTKESYDKQFGWQHLPKADWKAIYPFEDQMHDYEKQDPELVKIARLKKQAIQKQKRKQQAKEKFGNIPTNNPNTGLGLGE